MTENESRPRSDPGDAEEPLVITHSSFTPGADNPSPASARTLRAMAPVVQFGMFAIGVLYFVDTFNSLFSETPYTATQRFTIRTNAIVSLVYYGLMGWVAGGLLKGMAAAIGAMTDRARATERTAALVEGRLSEALERLAEAIERAPARGVAQPSTGPLPEDDNVLKERLLADYREALKGDHWQEAGDLAVSFAARFPDDPRGARLGDELAEAKQSATHGLLARLDAAREANDADRVLDLRDLLTRLLAPEALRSLDQELARWCMGLIQKRLRSGKMGVDVATLAARVADSLDTTKEGASLRAALPTLRRSAGLCARCGKPYPGIDDACPDCLAAAPPPPPATQESATAPSANGDLDSDPAEEDEWLTDDR